MHEVIGPIAADWTVWLGVAALLLLSGALTVWLELVRRKTYLAILSRAEPGTMVLDTDRHGRRLLVVRPLDHRPPVTSGQRRQGGAK